MEKQKCKYTMNSSSKENTVKIESVPQKSGIAQSKGIFRSLIVLMISEKTSRKKQLKRFLNYIQHFQNILEVLRFFIVIF